MFVIGLDVVMWKKSRRRTKEVEEVRDEKCVAWILDMTTPNRRLTIRLDNVRFGGKQRCQTLPIPMLLSLSSLFLVTSLALFHLFLPSSEGAALWG